MAKWFKKLELLSCRQLLCRCATLPLLNKYSKKFQLCLPLSNLLHLSNLLPLSNQVFVNIYIICTLTGSTLLDKVLSGLWGSFTPEFRGWELFTMPPMQGFSVEYLWCFGQCKRGLGRQTYLKKVFTKRL